MIKGKHRMRKRYLEICLVIVFYVLGCYTTVCWASDDVCYISSDRNLGSNARPEPIIAKEVGSGKGRTGGAVALKRGSLLAYPTNRVYNSINGTVDIWVSLQWDPNDAAAKGNVWLWGIEGDADVPNGAAIRFVQASGVIKEGLGFGGRGNPPPPGA